MRLSNGILALEFDERNGSLVRVTDLATERDHLSRPDDGRLFRLFVPDEERWTDRYCDSHESGQPELVSRPGGLDIRFKGLRAGDGTDVPIEATVHVALPEGADEALMTLDIENGDPHTVYEVIFPWIGGWTGYPGEDRGKIRCGSVRPFDPFRMRNPAAWNLLRSHRRANLNWAYIHAPMCDISGNGAGMSYNFYPVRQDRFFDLAIMDLAERREEGTRPSWAWVQRPFLRSGGSWTSDPVGIGTHSGDWHATADRMRRWLATWWTAPRAPERLRHSIGFHNAYFRDFTGRDWRPLSALPELARYGLEHGMDHFCIWDMSFLGLYIKAGTKPLFHNPPERAAELKRALAEARETGVETSALINLRLVERKNEEWAEWGEDRMIRSIYGFHVRESFPWRANSGSMHSPYLESFGTRLCQAYPAFQEWALEQIDTALELGLGTVFFDQPFSEDYCFAEHHGHPIGAPLHAGACDWVARGCQSVLERNPDAWLMGEVPDIWNSQVCNLWWHWNWNELKPEVFRYLLPESIQSWTIDAFEHEHEVGRAFALGHLLNVNVRSFELALPDAPALAARIKELAALRKKTAAVTADARFMDDRGLTMDTDAVVYAHRYLSDGGGAIVLGEGSPGGKGGGRVRLTLDGDAAGERTHAVLHRQDGSTEKVPLDRSDSGTSVELTLDRWECAVLQV